ncbi:FAD-dependent oxidoreductase [Bosea vaviloviae]|uniref:FAD-dependent oxidoreductase n=1 Tax=Bosea vaviloviae TaxID=1526658 RepID=A0A0N0M927_9HYPH|nr:FAD-dependent oxidoreductase [Bosea vaviloviae]KPH77351.1 FAD-dependent oxidoreductase [Bosea vaviloviae]
MARKTIAIIGAGPVGLAAAAHAVERGLTPILFERGLSIGHAVRQWAHVPMFSPWAYNIDAAAGRLLAARGWAPPAPDAYPTGGDLLALYLAPLAALAGIRDAIRLESDVTAISRLGFDKVKTAGRDSAPFAIRYRQGGDETTQLADAVIDVSGTWFSPNPAGASGLPAIGEHEATGRISYGMPDVLGSAAERYAGRRIAVLGGGHSAIGTLTALAELQGRAPATAITWLYRGDVLSRAFGGGAADQLAARGELGTRIARLVESGFVSAETSFRLERIETQGGELHLSSDDGRTIGADELIVATGFRPKLGLLRELRVQLDPALECTPALAPLIDPNKHSCGTVRPHGAAELAHPEAGFYIAGMKSYGRAPTFLLATGHEQVRSIVAEIAGDREAARRVELVLPETGVCSATPGGTTGAAAGCCGGPAPAAAEACCADDALAKNAGKPGCGCGTRIISEAVAV